jgi:hypothetical protein
LQSVIESAERLNSDSAKQDVFVAVARIAGADPEISARIRRAASTINSGSSLRNVMAELDRRESGAE